MQVRSSVHREIRGEVERAHMDQEDSAAMVRQAVKVGGLPEANGEYSRGDSPETPVLGRFASPNPLFAGCPSLFLQTKCGPVDLTAAAALVAVEETGIILTLDSRTKDHTKALRRAVAQCQATIAATTPDRPTGHTVLADANRYSGKNRAVATASGPNLDPAWIAAQRDLGLPVLLTDSPYVPAGDLAALAAVLEEARLMGDGVLTALPLHVDWLKKDVALLVSAINNAGVSVALVLEHTDDPLGVQDAVAGLVRLLGAAEVKIALLRSDISVIGAVAFGATFGAVGTTTGLRHLYPTSEKRSGFSGGARIGTYVPRAMAYRALDKLNTAIALDPEHQERWNCPCRHCYNRPLSSINDEVTAYQHSLAAIADLGEAVLGVESALQRQHAWLGQCSHAQVTNMEIADDTGLRWDPPKFQGAWHKLRPSLAPLP